VFVNEKISGLEQYLQSFGPSEELYARVEIGKSSEHHHKGRIWYAETNIHVGQGQVLFRAQSEREDLRVAITDVKNELQTQIRRTKEKIVDRDRQPQE